jgi:hypothetical protein
MCRLRSAMYWYSSSEYSITPYKYRYMYRYFLTVYSHFMLNKSIPYGTVLQGTYREGVHRLSTAYWCKLLLQIRSTTFYFHETVMSREYPGVLYSDVQHISTSSCSSFFMQFPFGMRSSKSFFSNRSTSTGTYRDTVIPKQNQFYGRAFKAERGARQGDILSPTLESTLCWMLFYINTTMKQDWTT